MPNPTHSLCSRPNAITRPPYWANFRSNSSLPCIFEIFFIFGRMGISSFISLLSYGEFFGLDSLIRRICRPLVGNSRCYGHDEWGSGVIRRSGFYFGYISKKDAHYRPQCVPRGPRVLPHSPCWDEKPDLLIGKPFVPTPFPFGLLIFWPPINLRSGWNSMRFLRYSVFLSGPIYPSNGSCKIPSVCVGR